MSELTNWQTDFLTGIYTAVKNRLKEIQDITRIIEAQELTSIASKNIRLNNAIYLIFEGFTPTKPNNRGKNQILELSFSVILLRTQLNPEPNLSGLGAMLTKICRALQGFEPKDEKGNLLAVSPLKQEKALNIQYLDGFGYFPLRFSCEVAVVI